MTVRRSINILADQDVVSTAQGRGTFVKALELGAARFGLEELQNLFMNSDDSEVKLLDVRVVTADKRTARKLGVEPGDNTIYIRRLMTRRGEPVFFHRAYLIYDPSRPVVEAEMDVTSLQGLFLNANNTMLKHGDLAIEAAPMNQEEADLLGVELPAAAFVLEHLFFDFEDVPISWGWFIVRGDRLRLKTGLGVDLRAK
jgi:GntR family transcriptional regulator